MNFIQLLANRNYIIVNKKLIKELGLEETIMLGELASECDYWLEKEMLEDGYFYSTIENIKDNTTLSEHKQRKALNNLINKKVVDTKVKGIPAKRYIKINEEQVLKILNGKSLKFLRTSPEKIEELVTEKLSGNNNNINNNKNNNKYNIYGEFKNVRLTDDEYKKLEEKNLLSYIEKLSSYIASKGKRYKSHYATILTWSRKNDKQQIAETPEWFNETLNNKEITLQEQNELDNILKEIGE